MFFTATHYVARTLVPEPKEWQFRAPAKDESTVESIVESMVECAPTNAFIPFFKDTSNEQHPITSR